MTQLKEERLGLGTEPLASDMISSAYDNTDLETCTLSLAYCKGEKRKESGEKMRENEKKTKKKSCGQRKININILREELWEMDVLELNRMQ